MPFAIPVSDGRVVCPCCKDTLHHCKRCWDEHHNGQRDKDYIEPKHFGQSEMSPKIIAVMARRGIVHNPSIKEDRNRPYKEGEYH
jgi:hypothetical protein